MGLANAKLLIEAPVNGGRNYNGPKVAKFIRNGSGALMLAYVAAGRLVGYYEPYMHAWDCMAGFCLVSEAGGYYHPFPTDGDKLTKGAPVFAAAPGAIDALKKIAGL